MKIYYGVDKGKIFNVFEYRYKTSINVKEIEMPRNSFKELCEGGSVLNYHITPKGYITKILPFNSEFANIEKEKLGQDLLKMSNRLGVKGELYDISLEDSIKLCNNFRFEGYTEDSMLCSRGIKMNNIEIKLVRNIQGVMGCVVYCKDGERINGIMRNYIYMGDLRELSDYKGIYGWVDKKIKRC